MNRRIAWLAAPWCLLASVVVGGQRRAAWYVPADAFVAVCYDGTHPGMGQTTLHAFFQEPEVKEAVRQWRPLIDKLLDAINDGAELDVAPVLRAATGCEIALGLVAPEQGGGEPEVVMAARVGAGDAPARRAVERLMAQLRGRAKPGSVKELTAGQAKGVRLLDKDGDPHHFCFHGDFFVDASTERLFKAAFDEATGKLASLLGAERAVLRVRYDHQAMMKGYGAEIDAETRKTLDALGISAVRSVEVSAVPRGKRLAMQIAVDMPEAAKEGGLAKWFADAPPADRELLKRVPADTTLFWLTSVNIPGLWDAVWEAIAKGAPGGIEEAKEGLAKLEGKLGMKVRDGFLEALDRGTVLIGNQAGGLMGGSLVVVQRVKDARKLEQAIGQVVNRLDLLLMDAGGRMGAVRTGLKPFQYRGHTCYYLWMMGAPALALAGWAPCYTKLDDVFVFAKHPLDLKDYLDFVAEKRPSVLVSPEFQTLHKLVPPNATSVSYGNWTDAIVALYNTVAPLTMLFQGFHKQMGIPQPIDVANMPSSRLIRRYARGTVAWSAFEKGRYRFEVHGNGVDFLSPHVAPTAGVAILAGMLLPALARARTEARLIRDRNNLNQIAKGCATYLNEFGDNRWYPKSIGELFDRGVIPDKGVFVSPLDKDPPKLPNGLPCSYVSCFERHPKRQFFDDFPPNMIMAWDRKPFVRGRRSVLFFDSHVELMAEARFERLLKELDEHVKRHTKERKAATEF